MNNTDPTLLSIYERLTKYPDSYTDEDLRDIMSWYQDRPARGQWGQFPAMAFLILEEREKRRSDDYTKEKK
jgi:hypothetical protein